MNDIEKIHGVTVIKVLGVMEASRRAKDMKLKLLDWIYINTTDVGALCKDVKVLFVHPSVHKCGFVQSELERRRLVSDKENHSGYTKLQSKVFDWGMDNGYTFLTSEVDELIETVNESADIKDKEINSLQKKLDDIHRMIWDGKENLRHSILEKIKE